MSMMIKPLAAMLSAGLLMIGCRTSPLVTDYGMTSSLSKTSQSTVYPNSSVPLKMEVKSTTDGKIKVEYVSCNLSGSLLVGGEEIQPCRFFEHDFSSPLYMSFVPEEAGEAELRFTVSNGVVTTDVDPLRFVVDEASFGLQMISDTVVTVGIKENLAFAIRRLQTKASSNSKASGNKFKISGRINKGRGVLQVKDKVLDDNSISSKSVLGQSSLAQIAAKTKGESTSVEVAKDEETQMYYTSMSIGENALIFDISDEYKFNLLVKSDIGQEEVHEVVIPIVLPELKASTSADGQTIQYKTTTPFTLTISEALHTDPFAVVPTLVNGDGVLRLESGRGQELVFGAKVDIAAGTHNLTFTPADLCAKKNVDIQFEITDSHQTVTTAHARFYVAPNPLSFILDNVSASTTHVTIPVTFTLTIDEQEAPESPYTLTYTADNKGTIIAIFASIGQR